MAVNIVKYGSRTVIDITDTTAEADKVLTGYAFYGEDGVKTTGSLTVQHYYTGSGAPSSSLGENGDIYLRT